MNLSGRFEVLDGNLKLNPTERARAVTAHNYLTAVLVTAGVAKRTRLQGSFARKTMLPPLHDIDKVVELVGDLRDLLTGPGGQAKAMMLIRDALAPHLPGASFEVKKHALGIVLPDEGFDFDAVPAFNPEDGSGWIVIADTEDEDWERSNTYALIDTIAARNQACDGRFVHQVRMVKQAVSIAGLADILPGLHTETFTYEAVTATMGHADAVAATLAAGAAILGGPYTEPTGVDLISTRLNPADVTTAKATLQGLAEHAAEAQRLAAGGHETAAALIWADIFGEAFPRPADEKGFIQRLYGPGASPTGSARTTPATRAWRPA
jgi:hypothetical protein